MGIDYYSCQVCNDVFSDAGDFGWCSECGNRLCGYCVEDMIKKYGKVEEDNEKYGWYGDNTPIKCDSCIKEKVDLIDKEIVELVKEYFNNEGTLMAFDKEKVLAKLKSIVNKYEEID